MCHSSRPSEGMEKRAVIRYGWTPPADCEVELEVGKPWLGARKVAGDAEAELEQDLAKRLADDVQRRLKR